MPNLQSWEFICRHPSDIPPGVPRTLTPPGARECVSPELVARMGGPVSQLYPEFARDFPQTAAAMERFYGPPVLALQTIRLSWIHCFILEGSKDNLVFGSDIPFSPKSGASFDLYHDMLPISWLELYRWMDSFGITQRPIVGPSHFNTPAGLTGRLYPREVHLPYAQTGIKTPKKEMNQFLLRMDSANMRCWLYTDAGDTLWIDEQRLDRKVYHARVPHLSDVAELANPGGTLDRYMAHVVGGGPSKDFDFRGH